MALFLHTFAQFFLLALTLLILARVLLSWVDPRGANAAAGFVFALTEPILAPVRRALPRTGPVDFSPTVVLIVLLILQRAV